MDSGKRKKSWRKSIYFTVIALFAVPVIVGILVFAYRTYKQKTIRDDTKMDLYPKSWTR
jgi:hypothetical protein